MKLQFKDNVPFYPALPDGWKLATIHDFYIGEDLIVNMPFLTHSEVSPSVFWASRTEKGFQEYNDFYLFLEHGRIYVLE